MGPTLPHAPPIHLASVYECATPQQADALLGGSELGYVYARDGHPNADMLAEKCRKLHGMERAVVTSTGMSALGLMVLSQLEPGDHLVLSDQLYGRTSTLLTSEAARWGVTHSVVDACDLNAVRTAIGSRTKLVLVETISNPLLRVADLAALAELAHAASATLLVDNTFAGPVVCRPVAFGADWVMESMTKSMNGHSDVVLGLLCGAAERWQRVPATLSTWGLSPAPFDCWLALRGLGTLAIRARQACDSALALAEYLSGASGVEAVHYPGLIDHPDHPVASQQFQGRFGSMVSFSLAGGWNAATTFVESAHRIPFCPSLGEIATTLSHPASTSHRSLPSAKRAALGITDGTIRLSVGIEATESIIEAVGEGLASLG